MARIFPSIMVVLLLLLGACSAAREPPVDEATMSASNGAETAASDDAPVVTGPRAPDSVDDAAMADNMAAVDGAMGNDTAMMTGDGGAEDPFPTFPSPAPRASGMVTLNLAYFARLRTLEAINARLTDALWRIGFRDTGRYATRGGFVLVTRMERFRGDGRSWSQAGRFDFADRRAVHLGEGFEIADYLRALFTAPVGRYRVLAFVVSDRPVTQTRTGMSAVAASELVTDGGATLPQALGARPVGQAHRVTVLVYEYARPQRGDPAVQLPGTLQGADHLDKMGFLAAIQR